MVILNLIDRDLAVIDRIKLEDLRPIGRHQLLDYVFSEIVCVHVYK